MFPDYSWEETPKQIRGYHITCLLVTPYINHAHKCPTLSYDRDCPQSDNGDAKLLFVLFAVIKKIKNNKLFLYKNQSTHFISIIDTFGWCTNLNYLFFKIKRFDSWQGITIFSKLQWCSISNHQNRARDSIEGFSLVLIVSDLAPASKHTWKIHPV